MSAGYAYTCGVRPDGSLECWGRDAEGQASPPPGSYTRVASGRGHTCAIRTDGLVSCWGEDRHGRATPPRSIRAPD